jgi:hypothetical protein
MEILTPKEAQERLKNARLCLYSPFEKCLIKKQPSAANCYFCLTDIIYGSLKRKDEATAMHALDGLVIFLKACNIKIERVENFE